ncbi:MAG: family 78 glycoside hydrolase catalytic domain [Kiritimatiellae bacterium]|nr:family 78 glycoside hydrolase catalytic domain [Kiritimatiellia bacterium]
MKTYKILLSAIATFAAVATFAETLALAPNDAPQWIRPAAQATTNANVAVFRRVVHVDREVARAEWRVAALGVFEARVNGTVVSRFLDPGFSQPEKTRFEVSYDVTSEVKRGDNVFEATVAPSWWRCRMTRRAYPKVGAPLPKNAALRATLRLTYEDGGADEFYSDPSWLSAYTGPIVDAGIFEGERVDARRTAAGFAASVRCDDFKGEVRSRQGPPVCLREDLVLKPIAAYVWSGVSDATDEAYGKVMVRRRFEPWSPVLLEPGETLVIDFAQNAAAVPRFELEGPAGAEMSVRMGEALNDANGEKTRRCDGPAGSVLLANLRSAAASIMYVFREGRQSYRPTFTFFGYRYASITVTAPVRILSVESVPVTSISAADESPVIVTDNAKVNRLAENVRWGFRSNYLEIPTDCPQRDERLGWTADTLAFVSAAEYSADVRGLLGKWLGDLRDSQDADGAFPSLAPLVWSFSGRGAVTGWSDAGILVPHRLWKRYGDRALLDAHWQAMTRYMDFIEAHRGPDKQHYGDWQAFEHSLAGDGPALRSPEFYRECFRGFFFVWDALAMKEMARDIGKADEARRYAKLEGEARAEFAAKYIGGDGLMHERYRGQTTDLFLLKLGLVSGEAAERTKAHLLADIRRHGDCLQTGFLGTMILMETLTEIGASDVAYTLLLQEKCPSWLFAVDNGATTVWERWDCYDPKRGFQDPGMNSFNHYAYGAVYSWMMSTMAGIREDPASPGMRHFILEPIPDGRIGFVKAAYDAPCGRIESEWRWRGDRCVWRFRIPEGASATVRFRGLPTRVFSAGEHELEAR